MQSSVKDLNRNYQSPSQKVLFAGVFIQMLFFILHLSVAIWVGLKELQVIAYTFLFGGIVWSLIWAHGFLKKKALFELQDNLRVDSLKKERLQSGRIFNQDEVVDGSFQQNLQRFERLIIPVVTGFLATIYLVYALYIDGLFKLALPPEEAKNLVKGSAFLCGFAFLLAMAGLYYRQLSKKYAFVRGGSTLLIVGALLCASQGVILVLRSNELIADLSWLITITRYLPFILFTDYVVSLLVSLLKPNHRGEERVVAYDLRLLFILTSTGLTLHSLSNVFRYQFGVEISENWFAEFFVKRFFPYLLFLGISAVLATSVVFIDSHEGGALLTWGKVEMSSGESTPKMKLMKPGIHLKAPWPIQTVKKFGLKEVSTVEVGHENHSHDEMPVEQLTTLGHYKESELFYFKRISKGTEHFEVVAISASFSFEPNSSDLHAYVFGYQDRSETVKAFLHAELAVFFSGLVVDNSISDGHTKWVESFEKIFFEKVPHSLPGVQPLRVSLTSMQYPAEMQESLRGVYLAEEKKKTSVMKAQTEATRIKELTDAYVESIRIQNEIRVNRLNLDAKNDKQIVDNLRDLYAQNKKLFSFWEKKAIEEDLLSKKDIDYIPSGVKLYLEDKSVKKNAIELFRD